jgi:hypothetical protein
MNHVAWAKLVFAVAIARDIVREDGHRQSRFTDHNNSMVAFARAGKYRPIHASMRNEKRNHATRLTSFARSYPPLLESHF